MTPARAFRCLFALYEAIARRTTVGDHFQRLSQRLGSSANSTNLYVRVLKQLLPIYNWYMYNCMIWFHLALPMERLRAYSEFDERTVRALGTR